MAEATQKFTPPAMAQERQTIIQCPACQTKFLVAASALQDVEFPRFHCSRCDNLFSLDAAALDGVHGAEVGEPSPGDGAPLNTVSIEDDSAAVGSVAAPHTPPPLIDDFAPIPGSSIDEFSLEPPPPPPVATRMGSTGATRGLEIPKGFDSRSRPAAPHEHRAEIDESQIAFDFIASSVPADRLFEETDRPAAPRATGAAPTPFPVVPSTRWGSTGWRAATAVGAPLAVCLGLLGIVGYGLANAGALSESTMAALFPAAPRVAPADLTITDAQFERIALANGESVHLITGTLTNDSPSDARDIVIEGLTFDAAGNQLSATKVRSGSTLAHSRIESLTPDVIANLQDGPHAKPLTVKAGGSEKITVALTDGAMTDARFFSARVFSVR